MIASQRMAPSDARALAVAAARMRREWLLGLAEGSVTVEDLFEFAQTVDGGPLRRLRIEKVIGSLDYVDRTSSASVLARLQSEIGLRVENLGNKTVGWLLDSRTKGQRGVELLAALNPPSTTAMPPRWPWVKELT